MELLIQLTRMRGREASAKTYINMIRNFKIGDVVLYLDKYKSIIVKIHEGYDLVDIEIQHEFGEPTKSTVSLIHITN